MEELERICFQIISLAGLAKNSYLAAVKEAKAGNFTQVQKCLDEGAQFFLRGHDIHTEILQKEAAGKGVPVNLLLLHAEDQLMSVETCKIFVDEFIATYQRVASLEEKLNQMCQP